MKTQCRMCGELDVECRHFELYVSGSEGVVLCHNCEMLLVEYVRTMARLMNTSFLRGYKSNTCKLTHGGGITRV